jgi:hypothetical protein
MNPRGAAFVPSFTAGPKLNENMNDKLTILVADPEPYSLTLLETVAGKRFHFIYAGSVEAVGLLTTHLAPSAVLTELLFSDGTWQDVQGKLPQDTPLVFLTDLPAFAQEQNSLVPCVDKRNMARELVSVLEKRLTPACTSPRYSTFSILLEPAKEMIAQYYGGGRQIERIPAPPWKQCEEFGQKLLSTPDRQWQRALDDAGRQLFALLDKSWKLQRLRELYLRNIRLRLQFVGTVESLDIPFEVLLNPAEQYPFCVQYPLCRTLLRENGSELWADSQFLAQAVRSARGARLLTIGLPYEPAMAADLTAELSHVSRLVAALNRRGFAIKHRLVPAGEASLERISQEIKTDRWDMVHIAGHCLSTHDGEKEPGIRFRTGTGTEERLTPAALQEMLRQNPPTFVFLSCCWGTEVFGKALSKSGVPGFLTLRWKHPSQAFVTFSQHFYNALAGLRDGDMEEAVQMVRNIMFASSGRQTTGVWAAPCLVLHSL